MKYEYESWCKMCRRFVRFAHRRGDQDGSHRFFKCVNCHFNEPIRIDWVDKHIADKKAEAEARARAKKPGAQTAAAQAAAAFGHMMGPKKP